MKIIFKYLLICLVGTALLQSCKKEGFSGTTDNRPAIPVTVVNAMDYRPDPAVFASRATGIISIQLTIPSSSGRSIKEITRVSASTTASGVQLTTGLYNTAPIPGSGNNATFNTTFTEYIAKAGGTIPTTNNTELAKRFYFLITLDDGTTIIPEPVRVVVVP